MIWSGRSAPVGPTVDRFALPASAEPRSRTAPAMTREPIARPAPVPSSARSAGAELTRVVAGRAAPVGRRAEPPRDRQTPPAAPATESGGGLVRGSDLWRRMFPERPSLMETLQGRGTSRRARVAQKSAPPVIPSRLPRTRTWEVKPGHSTVSAQPHEETVSLSADEGAAASEPDTDAGPGPREGPAEPEPGETVVISDIERTPSRGRPKEPGRGRVHRRVEVAEESTTAVPTGEQTVLAEPTAQVERERVRPRTKRTVTSATKARPSEIETPPTGSLPDAATATASKVEAEETQAAAPVQKVVSATDEVARLVSVQTQASADVTLRPESQPTARDGGGPLDTQTTEARPISRKPHRPEAGTAEAPSVAPPAAPEPREPDSPGRPPVEPATQMPPRQPLATVDAKVADATADHAPVEDIQPSLEEPKQRVPTLVQSLFTPVVQPHIISAETQPAVTRGREAKPDDESLPDAPDMQVSAAPEAMLDDEWAVEHRPPAKPQVRPSPPGTPSARPPLSPEVGAEPVVDTPSPPVQLTREPARVRASEVAVREAEAELRPTEPAALRQSHEEPTRGARPLTQPSVPRVKAVESPSMAATEEPRELSPRVQAVPRSAQPGRVELSGAGQRVRVAPKSEAAVSLEPEVPTTRVDAEHASIVGREKVATDGAVGEPTQIQRWHPFSGFSPLPMRRQVGLPEVAPKTAVPLGSEPSQEVSRTAGAGTLAAPGRPRLPLHVPAAPAVAVQREESGTAESATAAAEAPETGESETAGEPEIDKDRLAREVYEILKRRMVVEREQFWGF